MTKLEAFFDGGDKNLGIFYPKDYLLAIFPTLTEASSAKRVLEKGEFAERELLAVSGEEVVAYSQDQEKNKGVWSFLASGLAGSVSRLIGTEAVYADADLAMAKEGRAFLVVHAPTEKKKSAAWAVLEPLNPVVARHYSFGGTEVLRGVQADHLHLDK